MNSVKASDDPPVSQIALCEFLSRGVSGGVALPQIAANLSPDHHAIMLAALDRFPIDARALGLRSLYQQLGIPDALIRKRIRQRLSDYFKRSGAANRTLSPRPHFRSPPSVTLAGRNAVEILEAHFNAEEFNHYRASLPSAKTSADQWLPAYQLAKSIGAEKLAKNAEFELFLAGYYSDLFQIYESEARSGDLLSLGAYLFVRFSRGDKKGDLPTLGLALKAWTRVVGTPKKDANALLRLLAEAAWPSLTRVTEAEKSVRLHIALLALQATGGIRGRSVGIAETFFIHRNAGFETRRQLLDLHPSLHEDRLAELADEVIGAHMAVGETGSLIKFGAKLRAADDFDAALKYYAAAHALIQQGIGVKGREAAAVEVPTVINEIIAMYPGKNLQLGTIIDALVLTQQEPRAKRIAAMDSGWDWLIVQRRKRIFGDLPYYSPTSAERFWTEMETEIRARAAHARQNFPEFSDVRRDAIRAAAFESLTQGELTEAEQGFESLLDAPGITVVSRAWLASGNSPAAIRTLAMAHYLQSTH